MAISLWLRSADPRPGPRPALTLEDIADACVDLVDREGLKALSMRRVAGALGGSAASLYRYVSGKDDLLELMADRVLADYDLPPLTGDVRADVLAVAQQSRELHRRHPWLREVTATDLGPNAMRYLDHMVGALTPAGMQATETMMGVALITGWVTNFAAQESGGTAVSSSGSGAGHLAAMMDQGEYPHLTALFQSSGESASSPLDNDLAFAAGIEALLFGITPGAAAARPLR